VDSRRRFAVSGRYEHDYATTARTPHGGAAIAFEGDSPKGTRDSELFTVAMNSGRIHQLTRNRGLDADPAWSRWQVADLLSRPDPDWRTSPKRLDANRRATLCAEQPSGPTLLPLRHSRRGFPRRSSSSSDSSSRACAQSGRGNSILGDRAHPAATAVATIAFPIARANARPNRNPMYRTPGSPRARWGAAAASGRPSSFHRVPPRRGVARLFGGRRPRR
jgi:hypothetical protein